MNPLDRLRLDGSVAAVDAGDALAFARKLDAGLVFLPGRSARPEVAEVARALGELHAHFPALALAVVEGEREETLREAFGVTSFPSVLFVKEGVVKIAFAQMQTRAIYEGAARSIASAP